MQKSILNKSFPLDSDINSILKTIFAIAFFIFVFVFIFRSEDKSESGEWTERILISFCYALWSFVIPLINVLIAVKIFDEKKTDWKVKHEIVLLTIHLITISIGNFFLNSYFSGDNISFINLLSSIGITSSVGLIPITVYVLVKQNKILQEHIASAKMINKSQNVAPKKQTQVENINIESTSIPISKLIFAESDKNYIRFQLDDTRELKLRLTMKELENHINNSPNLVRCHRAYVVNRNQILNVEGNAQGLKISLKDHEKLIPVSRNYIDSFKVKERSYS